MDLKKRKEPVDRMSRAQQEATYQPYDSNTDLDSDTDTDLDSDTDSTEDARIRREQDPRYAILVAPGPNLAARNNTINPIVVGAPWDETTNIRSLVDHVYLDPPKTTKTSLVSIKSTDRDTNVFPTPFRFQLKLPRVYKDVTKFQLVQMSFPNGANNVVPTNLFTSSLVLKLLAQGVPSSCLSTCVSVIDCSLASHSLGVVEQGRLTPAGEPLLGTIAIPHGNYSESQMASELTFQANSTPPLNLVSYEDFKDVFMTTRDISILFSEPGNSYYSAITNARYHAHTKDNIMNTYYNQQHIDMLPEITESVAYVAYYFPILKEMVASGRSQPFLRSDALSMRISYKLLWAPFRDLKVRSILPCASRIKGHSIPIAVILLSRFEILTIIHGSTIRMNDVIRLFMILFIPPFSVIYPISISSFFNRNCPCRISIRIPFGRSKRISWDTSRF